MKRFFLRILKICVRSCPKERGPRPLPPHLSCRIDRDVFSWLAAPFPPWWTFTHSSIPSQRPGLWSTGQRPPTRPLAPRRTTDPTLLLFRPVLRWTTLKRLLKAIFSSQYLRELFTKLVFFSNWERKYFNVK